MAKNPGHRPRRNTPEQVMKAVDQMISENDIDINNNNNNSNGDKVIKQGYGDALKKLISYRNMVCMYHLTGDRFNSGWIFLSKQPHWGGFQDVQRVESKGNQTFTVCIQGADGKPLKE